ncbi:MAG: 30S ribosomal protein S6, partial [Proteobacteria bacterium]|nr:30S ribosomal protein S6 [Pseudomonadota bacterium]
HDNTPSPLMQQKTFRDDRRRFAEEDFDDELMA